MYVCLVTKIGLTSVTMSCHHTKFNVMLHGISSDENWPQRYHCI